MMTKIFIAGFGGQGVLFSGKQIAKNGMNNGKEVTWLPCYGPESRGGTSYCSVIVADEEIGCPIISDPDILFAFNLPSFDKFESTVKSGGTMFIDSSLVTKKTARTDVTAYYVPATAMASDNGLTGGANVIMLGYFIKKTGMFDKEEFVSHLVDGIPASKAQLIENNKKAFELGYNYEM
ncbi:MAG: 2-oxoacid:ferredoxin oxidoreductase subunit gamma [Ruminococcaceae bacterium]|nr:2-oxoacid:ferredoxin oxidoreductase subunit gamma [Oscillospiraceae bacterium]